MQQQRQQEEDESRASQRANHEGYGLVHGNYYAQLPNQQHMLEDTIRTATYQSSVINNLIDFMGKVVLDVGAGSGILSFFAVQAGARKIYAVEATSMAEHASMLVAANGLADRIQVIRAKVEDLELPEKVDVIVSEPMGVFLVHERMLESYLLARSRWLKPGGKMFPSTAKIFLAPFSDSYLHTTTLGKARFWEQKSFFGVDLSKLASTAREHHFSSPVVGPVDPNSLMAKPAEHVVDFNTVTPDELTRFDIRFNFIATSTGIVHGLAGWFNVSFDGTVLQECLTTSPDGQGTHWHQIRFLFSQPLAMNVGQRFSGTMSLSANEQRSYDLSVVGGVDDADVGVTQTYYLNNQRYWWYSSAKPDSAQAYPENYGLYPPEI